MKKLFTALLLLVGFAAFSQSIGRFRYDTTILEKVGGNNEFVLLNSTRDSIGVLFNMGNGRTRFRTISSLGISPNVANGIKKSVDTLILGDSLNRYTYIYAAHRFLNGSRYNGLQITNDTTTQEPYPFFLTYNPAALGVRRVYSTTKGDIDSAFYGSNISSLWQMFRDSTDALFKAGARSEILPGIGVEAVGQYYPPRDSMVLKTGRDGQSGNVLFGQLDIGHSWGYNIFVRPPTTMPGLPISAARTSIDLSRVIDNTRSKKMTGAGVAGFTSMYKTYQSTITSATYPSGSYTDSVFGFKAYGDAHPLISGATKAQTLAVWTVKNAFGFYVDPQYRYTNTVDNGYSLYAAGDSDILVNKGFAYFGPSTSPQRQNNTEGLRYRTYVTGRGWYTDSLHAFIVDGYSISAQIPRSIGTQVGITFTMKDSNQAGTILVSHPDSRDSRHMAIRMEGFTAVEYPDQSPGMYIRFETGGNHANVSRISRNGNWTFGNTAAALAYRWWKKGTFSGSTAFLDTMTYVNTPIAPFDTTNYKPIWQNTANGDLYRGYHSGGGGGGGGTIGGSIALNQVAFGSGTNTIQGNSNFTYDGNAAILTSSSGVSLNVTGATGSSSNYAARFTGRVAMGGVTTPFNDLDVGAGGISAGALTISTAAGSTAIGNFSISSTNLLGTNTGALYQYDGSSNSDGRVYIGGTGATQIGAGRPYSTLVMGASTVPEASSGNHPFIGTAIFIPPTITTGAATVTDASTVRITGPTAVTVSGTNSALLINSGNLRMDNGSISLGVGSPTASLHLRASTTAASSGQIKFTEGAALTTPENGTLNYVSNNLEFTETSTVYTLAKTLKATATLDFVSTITGNSSELTISVTGAVAGDPVALAIPHGQAWSGSTFTAWVSGSGTVTVRFNNYSGSTIDPTSDSFTVSVIHY